MRRSWLVCLGVVVFGCEASGPRVELDAATASSRERSCGTRTLTAEERAVDEQLRSTRRADHVAAPRVAGSVVIPVVVHEVRDTNGVGALTSSRIAQQLAVLDRAFSGQDTGYPTEVAANTPFRFQLVGHTVTVNHAWFVAGFESVAEREMKAQLRAGGADTLNVYTINPAGGLAGWSAFPQSYATDPTNDGVVIYWDTLPGGAPPFDLGDVAVHEVGHWLGLFHTFENGCQAPGDDVGDTAPQRFATAGCPAPAQRPDTCAGGGPDPVYNFMDYTDDSCMFAFTAVQAARMDELHSVYRSNLPWCTADTDCNDADACTTDRCVAGSCTRTAISCSDGDACTTDVCDPATGCSSTPEYCEDDDTCTMDTCDPQTGACSFPALDCDDENACTIDGCIQNTGCSHALAPQGAPCGNGTCDGNGACVASNIHVGDLDAIGQRSGGMWRALVTIHVHADAHGSVANAVVGGAWNIGGAATCTTDASGACTVLLAGIPKNQKTRTFTVTSVVAPSTVYAPAANHEPDGDGTGTSIVIARP